VTIIGGGLLFEKFSKNKKLNGEERKGKKAINSAKKRKD
jgi:hypothetical protein